MVLTIDEKLEIIEISRKLSYSKTAERFNNLHPNRPVPINKHTVVRIFKHLRERGELQRKKRSLSHRYAVERATLRQEVLQLFNNNPHMSTRRAGNLLGVSHSTHKEIGV